MADEVSQKAGNIGYDANTGEYVDMYKAGIIDPVKVVRTALQQRRQHRRPAADDRSPGHQLRQGRQEPSAPSKAPCGKSVGRPLRAVPSRDPRSARGPRIGPTATTNHLQATSHRRGGLFFEHDLT